MYDAFLTLTLKSRPHSRVNCAERIHVPTFFSISHSDML